MSAFPGVVGPSHALASPRADCERSINCWRERITSGQGDNTHYLRKSAGFVPYITDVTGVNRGAFELNGHIYRVVDDRLYDYVAGTQIGSYGPLANNGQPVQMCASPTALMILSSSTLYRLSGTLSTIVLGFPPIFIAFTNNYFVSGETGLFQRFYWSEDDGLTFPAANVQTAEADANAMVNGVTVNQQLLIIGNRVTQFFSIGTNADAPFVPMESVEVGTRAANSVKVVGDSVYMLESTREGAGSVVRLTGYQAERVSDYYAAHFIAGLSTTTDAIGQAYHLEGHDFIRWTFPTADKTLEYHVQENDWSEIAWFDWHGIAGVSGTYHRHRAAWIIAADGYVLFGDHTNGMVCRMSFDIHHDGGFPLRWNRRTPYLVEEGKEVFISELRLGIETGVGLTTPLCLHTYDRLSATFVTNLADAVTATSVTAAQAIVLQKVFDCTPHTPLTTFPTDATMTSLGFTKWGEDPQIVMSFSKNNGNVFGQERSRSMGRAGAFLQVVRWNRIGASPAGVFDFYSTDPTKLALTSASIEAEAN